MEEIPNTKYRAVKLPQISIRQEVCSHLVIEEDLADCTRYGKAIAHTDVDVPQVQKLISVPFGQILIIIFFEKGNSFLKDEKGKEVKITVLYMGDKCHTFF